MSGTNHPKPTTPTSSTSIQNDNWSGSIPILLSLAPTSLSSPTLPRPIHKMISRVTYLHVALHEEVIQFSSYAPVAATLSSAASGMSVEEPPDGPMWNGGSHRGEESERGANETESPDYPTQLQHVGIRHASYPACWFEDEGSGAPLRWHLFVGVLYDLMQGRSILGRSFSSSGAFKPPAQHNFLPWRMRVHFTSYPIDQLLPLDDGIPQKAKFGDDVNKENNAVDDSYGHITSLVGRIFRNSLKQALFLQYGSSKVAMSITKASHENIWDALLQSSYGSYYKVNLNLQLGIKTPPISGIQSTLFGHANLAGKDEQGDIPQLIPVRLMMNGMPAIQKPTKHGKKCSRDDHSKRRPGELLEQFSTYQTPCYTTLGDVLSDLLPNYFQPDVSTGCVMASVIAGLPTVHYFVQGVQPSMRCAMLDLWKALSHPDHFLYITVVTK